MDPLRSTSDGPSWVDKHEEVFSQAAPLRQLVLEISKATNKRDIVSLFQAQRTRKCKRFGLVCKDHCEWLAAPPFFLFFQGTVGPSSHQIMKSPDLITFSKRLQRWLSDPDPKAPKETRNLSFEAQGKTSSILRFLWDADILFSKLHKVKAHLAQQVNLKDAPGLCSKSQLGFFLTTFFFTHTSKMMQKVH